MLNSRCKALFGFVLCFCCGGSPVNADEDKCAPDDRLCITAWYSDYKAKILNEFVEARKLEDEIAGAFFSKDDFEINRVRGIWIRKDLYQHLRLPIKADLVSMMNAGINMKDFDVLFSDCRTAIIELKYLLLPAHDLQQYRERAKACETYFGLGHPHSRLRGEEQSSALPSHHRAGPWPSQHIGSIRDGRTKSNSAPA